MSTVHFKKEAIDAAGQNITLAIPSTQDIATVVSIDDIATAGEESPTPWVQQLNSIEAHLKSPINEPSFIDGDDFDDKVIQLIRKNGVENADILYLGLLRAARSASEKFSGYRELLESQVKDADHGQDENQVKHVNDSQDEHQHESEDEHQHESEDEHQDDSEDESGSEYEDKSSEGDDDEHGGEKRPRDSFEDQGSDVETPSKKPRLGNQESPEIEQATSSFSRKSYATLAHSYTGKTLPSSSATNTVSRSYCGGKTVPGWSPSGSYSGKTVPGSSSINTVLDPSPATTLHRTYYGGKTLPPSYPDRLASSGWYPGKPGPSSRKSTQSSNARSLSAKKGAWSDAEHEAIYDAVRARRQFEQSTGARKLRDVAFWTLISTELEIEGYTRSHSACKNYWSREGRARSGYEERLNPPANGSLVSSAQVPKGKKDLMDWEF